MSYSISGGLLRDPISVPTMTAPGAARATPQRSAAAPSIECGYGHDGDAGATPDLEIVFVKLDKSAEWLVKAAGGGKAQRGYLKRTTLV